MKVGEKRAAAGAGAAGVAVERGPGFAVKSIALAAARRKGFVVDSFGEGQSSVLSDGGGVGYSTLCFASAACRRPISVFSGFFCAREMRWGGQLGSCGVWFSDRQLF